MVVERFNRFANPASGAMDFAEDLLRSGAREAFPNELVAPWLRACARLVQAGYGDAVPRSYIRHSPEIARRISPDLAIDMASTVSATAIKAGRRAAALLPEAAVAASERLTDGGRMRSWLGLMERLGAIAPESVIPVLARTAFLLSRLNAAGLDSWVLAGIRAAGGDAERRLRYFTLKDPEAERWLNRESGSIGFIDLEARLKLYLNALWGINAPLREPPISAPELAKRRPGCGGGVIRLPTSYPGFRGTRAEYLYRAAVAHVGAHYRFTREKFPIGELKPVQVALVSIIEDARVEQLAMRDFPGLRRLWLPFHIAQSSGSRNAPALFARLARSLIDRDFHDADTWVTKARGMFFAAEKDWEDQAISRQVGNSLGNDLGQMRVQFNARTYVVEPPYRDDNLGLWEFGDDVPQNAMEATQLFDSVRFDTQDDDTTPPDRNREQPEENQQADANRVRLAEVELDGVPVARYPEYDHLAGHDRPEWTTVLEYQPTVGRPDAIERLLEERADLVNRLTSLIRATRASRAERMRHQPEGEFLDLEACIEAIIARRAGASPDPRIHGRYDRRNRDLSVLVLLDISESTRDKVLGSPRSVLDVERQATALLAHAMSELGDPFAIAAFCSDRREDVHYLRIKDFGARYDDLAKSCLAGLESGLSTRLGAAIRHAGADLARQLTYRRLLLVISDGEPSDIDIDDPVYLVEDARRAVIGLSHAGIDTFCVGLDSGGDNYLSRIFGRRNVVQIDHIDRLPERLPMLYLRLTA